MASKRILLLGDPLLRTVSTAASALEAAPVFDHLKDTLHEFRRTHGFGREISAIQIGEAKRLIYIEIGGRSYRLRNPVFDFQSPEKFQLWDDCFSFPNLLVWLERFIAKRPFQRYEDEAGESHIIEARDAFSELFTARNGSPGEIGVLAVDRAMDRNAAFAPAKEYAHGINCRLKA